MRATHCEETSQLSHNDLTSRLRERFTPNTVNTNHTNTLIENEANVDVLQREADRVTRVRTPRIDSRPSSVVEPRRVAAGVENASPIIGKTIYRNSNSVL